MDAKNEHHNHQAQPPALQALQQLRQLGTPQWCLHDTSKTLALKVVLQTLSQALGMCLAEATVTAVSMEGIPTRHCHGTSGWKSSTWGMVPSTHASRQGSCDFMQDKLGKCRQIPLQAGDKRSMSTSRTETRPRGTAEALPDQTWSLQHLIRKAAQL